MALCAVLVVVGVSLHPRLVPCACLALLAHSWWVLLGGILTLAWIRRSCRPCNPFPTRAEIAPAAWAGVLKVMKANPFRSLVHWSISKLVLVSGPNFPSSVPMSSSVVGWLRFVMKILPDFPTVLVLASAASWLPFGIGVVSLVSTWIWLCLEISLALTAPSLRFPSGWVPLEACLRGSLAMNGSRCSSRPGGLLCLGRRWRLPRALPS